MDLCHAGSSRDGTRRRYREPRRRMGKCGALRRRPICDRFRDPAQPRLDAWPVRRWPSDDSLHGRRLRQQRTSDPAGGETGAVRHHQHSADHRSRQRDAGDSRRARARTGDHPPFLREPGAAASRAHRFFVRSRFRARKLRHRQRRLRSLDCFGYVPERH